MTDNSSLSVYHRTRRQRQGGSRTASTLFALLGMACAALGLVFLGAFLGLISWGIAVLFFAVGFLVDARYETIDYCDACGNRFESTTRICPTCHAQILTPPKPPFWNLTMKLSVGLVVTLVLGLFVLSLFL
jgi:hypothetical protein